MVLLGGKHYLVWLADIRSMMAATGISKISHVLKANRDAHVMSCYGLSSFSVFGNQSHGGMHCL